jgi:hypothetical protein
MHAFYLFGIQYQLKQTQIGLGYSPTYSKHRVVGPFKSHIFSVSGQYHFLGHSRFSARKPWFVKSSFIYFIEKQAEPPFSSDDIVYKMGMVTLGVGRDFNFSKRMGLTVVGGIAHYLFDIHQTASRRQDYSELYANAQYNFELIFFYRLLKIPGHS